MIRNRNVLITGGAGFIGSNMVEYLLDGNKVSVVDDLSNTDERYIREFFSRDNFEFVKMDITKEENFAELGDFDLIIHLAANSDVRGGSADPLLDFRSNVVGTLNVLEFMRKKDIPEIAFSSSSTVYGEASVLPTPESYGPYMPISSYGASKMAGEGFITAYSHYYGMRGTIFRFANIVGRNSTHGVIFDFINKLRKDGKKLEILGDGTQRKSYMHVSDCISSMIYVHERSRKTDIFNLGNDETTSVKRIADIITDKMGLRNVEYEFTGGIEGRGWKGDVKVAQLGIDKLKEYGWKNRYSSDQAVEKAVEESLEQLS